MCVPWSSFVNLNANSRAGETGVGLLCDVLNVVSVARLMRSSALTWLMKEVLCWVGRAGRVVLLDNWSGSRF